MRILTCIALFDSRHRSLSHRHFNHSRPCGLTAYLAIRNTTSQSALFERKELISDTNRARCLKLYWLVLDLGLLIALNNVRAIKRSVILNPQRDILVEADRRMIA